MSRKVELEFRRGTAAAWNAANPVLASGEPGYETDTGKLKVGDGATAWTTLPYFSAGSSGVSSLDAITGAITLVAGANITISDNSPGAGQITIAASGGTGLVKLFESTLSGAAASIDTGAGGISAGHGDLLILVVSQSTKAAAQDQLNITFNNDTGANYDRQVLFGSDASSGAVSNFAQTAIQITTHGANGSQSSYPGVLTIHIPAYDKTTFFKQGTMVGGLVDSGAGNSLSTSTQIGYRSTTAISRMKIAPAGGNLAIGSRLAIFGTE